MSCSICWGGNCQEKLTVGFEGQREMKWGQGQMTVLQRIWTHPFHRPRGRRAWGVLAVTLDTSSSDKHRALIG